MRKTLAIGTTALALLFGGAGVANATEIVATPTTTAVAQEVDNDDGDNTGLWGLAGLLGLLGLAGLKRRKDADHVAVRPAGSVNPPPRA